MKKNLIYSTIDQINVSLMNFLFILLGAHFLGLEDQSKLLSIFFIFIFLIILGFGLNFANSFHLNKNESHRLIVLNFKFYLIFLIFFSSVSAYILIGSRDFLSFMSCLGFIFFMSISDYIRRAFYFLEKPLTAMSIGIFTFIFRVLIIGLFVLFFRFTLPIYLLLWSSTVFIALIYYLHYFNFQELLFLKKDFIEYKLHFKRAKYGVLNQSLGWINNYVPFYFLSYFSGSADAAIFGSVRSLSSFMNLITEQFDTILPKFFKEDYSSLIKQPFFLFICLFIFWLFVFIMLIILGGKIINLFLGDPYSSYTYILTFSWIGIGIYLINRFRILKLRLNLMFKKELYANTLSSFGMAISLIFIFFYGLKGAAISSILIPGFYLGYLIVKK